MLDVDPTPPPSVDDLPDLPIPDITGETPNGTTPDRWTSYSSLSTFRRCPQQWAYKSLRNLERDDSVLAPEREMGTWWHAVVGADAIKRGRALGSLRKYGERVEVGADSITLDATDPGYSPEVVLDAAGVWWQALSELNREEWLDTMGAPLPNRLEKMFVDWCDEWESERQHEAPLAVELGFGRPLPGVTPEAILPGYIDEVFYDTRKGFAVVRDHKSSKTLPASSTTADMLESQLPLYGWAITPVVAEWGYDVRALAYDRARAGAPKMPALTQAGALSKSVTDYDLATYLQWCQGPDGDGVPWGTPGEYYKSGKNKDAPKFGVYHAEDAVIAKLSDPAARSAWFQRAILPWNPQAVLHHLRSAVWTQQQMVSAVAMFTDHGEAPRNFGRTCQWCDFQQLCAAELVGGPAGDYPLEDFRLRKRAPRKTRLDSIGS